MHQLLLILLQGMALWGGEGGWTQGHLMLEAPLVQSIHFTDKKTDA